MAQAIYRLAKVNGDNYSKVSLAMCYVINSLNHQNCLTEASCIMPILLLNICSKLRCNYVSFKRRLYEQSPWMILYKFSPAGTSSL